MGLVFSSIRGTVCNEQLPSPVETNFTKILHHFSSTNPYFKLHIILLSLLFFTLTFIAINLLSYTSRSFKQLNPLAEVFWCQTFVSIIFSLLTTPLALRLITGDQLKSDIVHNITLSSVILLSFGIGFNSHKIITQLSSCLLFNHTNSYLLIHNIFSVLGASLVLYYNQGHFLGCLSLLSEVPITSRSLWMVLKDVQVSSKASHLVFLLSICLNVYCPLLGLYCMLLTYLQWETIEGEMSFLFLFVIYPSLLIELFIIALLWSYNSMKELFTSAVNCHHTSKLSTDDYSSVVTLSSECNSTHVEE